MAGASWDEVVTRKTDALNIWTAWSLVHLHLALGFTSHLSEQHWGSRSWAHVDGLEHESEGLLTCTGHCSFPGPLQTVQRAEFWWSFLPCRLLMLRIWRLIT